jgi:23S rRNA (adenine2503-C2)-methyltransferase
MPVNNLWPLHELIEACADYTALTGRIITYEYTLIAGRNDQPHHADALTRLLRYQQCRINLIPLSPVPHFTGNAPTAANCARFQAILTRAGINTTLRNSRGSGADAACGQLRLRRRHS